MYFVTWWNGQCKWAALILKPFSFLGKLSVWYKQLVHTMLAACYITLFKKYARLCGQNVLAIKALKIHYYPLCFSVINLNEHVLVIPFSPPVMASITLFISDCGFVRASDFTPKTQVVNTSRVKFLIRLLASNGSLLFDIGSRLLNNSSPT